MSDGRGLFQCFIVHCKLVIRIYKVKYFIELIFKLIYMIFFSDLNLLRFLMCIYIMALCVTAALMIIKMQKASAKNFSVKRKEAFWYNDFR